MGEITSVAEREKNLLRLTKIIRLYPDDAIAVINCSLNDLHLFFVLCRSDTIHVNKGSVKTTYTTKSGFVSDL